MVIVYYYHSEVKAFMFFSVQIFQAFNSIINVARKLGAIHLCIIIVWIEVLKLLCIEHHVWMSYCFSSNELNFISALDNNSDTDVGAESRDDLLLLPSLIRIQRYSNSENIFNR